MNHLLVILIGIILLAGAGWPGLLDDLPVLRSSLLVIGVFISILGEVLVWRAGRSLAARVEAVQPRRLSDEQRASLVRFLSTREKGWIGFCSRLMDGESADFALQLSESFEEAGWQIRPQVKTSLNDFPGYVSLFRVGPDPALDAHASTVAAALVSAGVDCRVEAIEQSSIGGQIEPNSVYVVVGRR